MIKKSLMIFIGIIVLLSNIALANMSTDKVLIKYYWGIGCSHCEEIEPFIEKISLKYQDKINLQKYEVFQDNKNFQQLINDCKLINPNINTNRLGTPTIIINNKILMGSGEIENSLENEINNSLGINISPEKVEKEQEHNSGFYFTGITLSAIADSINPCAFMVLIVLLSSLLVFNKNDKQKIILTATSFIIAVFLAYFLIGLGFTFLLNHFELYKPIKYIVAVIAIIVGILNLTDSFSQKKTKWSFEIPQQWRSKLFDILLKASNPYTAFIVGFITTLFELPCTGGPYLFALSLMNDNFSFISKILLLLYYNIIFILPLVVLTICIIKGFLTIEKAENINIENNKKIKFVIGCIMFLLGILILF